MNEVTVIQVKRLRSFTCTSFTRKLCALLLLSLITIPLIKSPAYAQNTTELISGLHKASSFYIQNDIIYVVESGKNRILKLITAGKRTDSLGGRGSGMYAFNNPLSIHATNGLKIYLSDTGNRRIQVFDRRFQYLTTIGGGEGAQQTVPGELAVNDLGELWYADRKNKKLVMTDADGNIIGNMHLPQGIQSVKAIQFSEGECLIWDGEQSVLFRLNEAGISSSATEMPGVKAVYRYKRINYKAYDTYLEAESREGSIRIAGLNSEINIMDIQVTEQYIYLLGTEQILRINRPQ